MSSIIKIIAGFGAGSIALYFILGAVIGGWLWPYAINAWLLYFGKTASVVWWQGALLGIVPAFGYLCLPISAITFITMMFIL
jgi:hypothetical protein